MFWPLEFVGTQHLAQLQTLTSRLPADLSHQTVKVNKLTGKSRPHDLGRATVLVFDNVNPELQPLRGIALDDMELVGECLEAFVIFGGEDD